MIAQIVFDLPVEGPFDYSIPEALVFRVCVGMRVKVSFGPKSQTGFVIGLINESTIAQLKPILSLVDEKSVFNDLDLGFARDFGIYYGCSLGEALATILRNKETQAPSLARPHQPAYTLYRCLPPSYAGQIQKIMKTYQRPFKDTEGTYCQFLILVPDSFRARTISSLVQGAFKIGTRSVVFEADGRYDCVIMVDDQDASFKQEQSPMYDTRQVLMARSRIYGFDIAFVGVSPSIELMHDVVGQKVKMAFDEKQRVQVRPVDLSQYKYLPGLLSPPVRDALEAALKKNQKVILVLNRRGSYRMTRCVECGEVLKCQRCDSSLVYSRTEGKYLCRHCTFIAPGDTVCPKCHKPSWRSQGIGVEQLQSELKKFFPLAKIVSFEREKGSKPQQSQLAPFDILIGTQALLRFQGQWQAGMAAFIDFDAELNRLDMRSAFNAYALVLHVAGMSAGEVFVQTRNNSHYVVQALNQGSYDQFYDEELKLRKEFGFSPFKHWIKISWRGKVEKSTQQAAQEVYNSFVQQARGLKVLTPPLADPVGRKRDQFRFNVMMQADQIPQAMAFIKSTLAGLKRRNRVIITIHVDP